MIFWLALGAFLIPLIYLLATAGRERSSHKRQLERVQRQIAAREAADETHKPSDET